MRIKIKKGDQVTVLAGKDRGKTGAVERVLPKEGRVVVTGINLQKHHTRPRRGTPHGGIVIIPGPLPIAKVMAICPRCQKPTRVAITIDAQGKRHRACRRCQEVWTKEE